MKTINGSKVILASASPRRRELLKLILPDFDVIPSNFDEEAMLHCHTPEQHVIESSAAKALDVQKSHPNAVIIGADTIVVVNGKILGKPRNNEEARQMLRLLSGRSHYVYTGLTVISCLTQTVSSEYERTEVKFAKLTNAMIEKYIASGEPMDKAGAYAIQGRGSILVERITGCYFNVVGLPVFRLSRMLKKAGLNLEIL